MLRKDLVERGVAPGVFKDRKSMERQGETDGQEEGMHHLQSAASRLPRDFTYASQRAQVQKPRVGKLKDYCGEG